jgi:hypothetical protein
MEERTTAVSTPDELSLWHLCVGIITKVRSGQLGFDQVRDGLVAISEGRAFADPIPQRGEKSHQPKHNLAEARRAEIEAWYRGKGLNVAVPMPDVSNRQLKAWAELGKAIFFIPAKSVLTYERFMTAVGQGNHWTVKDEAARAKIGWEPVETGRWFLLEVAPVCPRLKTSWNNLTAQIRLPSLEEYTVAYWIHKGLTRVCLDVNTWCWLRTRFGLGVLNAYDDGGRVDVFRDDSVALLIPCGHEGGRAVEVVRSM